MPRTCSSEYGKGANSMPTQLLLPSVSFSRKMRPLRSVSPLAREGCEMSDTALRGGKVDVGRKCKRQKMRDAPSLYLWLIVYSCLLHH